jgi:hypothetical protein
MPHKEPRNLTPRLRKSGRSLFQFAAADMIQHRHPYRDTVLDLFQNVRLIAVDYI